MATDDPVVVACPICGGDVLECECTPEAIDAARARAEAGQEPLVDASNPAQTAKMAKAVKRSEQEDADDLSWLMRHPQGRRIMWRLLDEAGIFRSAYALAGGDKRTGADTNATMFNLGASNFGLTYFIRVMKDEPEGYGLMVKENSGRLAA